MDNIDLSDVTVRQHAESFNRLSRKPPLSISDDTDIQILFFKRKDKYVGVREGLKSDFQSREEFIVYSFMIEEIRANIQNKLVLEQLTIEGCSNEELENIFVKATRIAKQLPRIADVEHSYIIANNSDLNWAFLEGESKYHSLFWSATEAKFFSRCA